LEVAPTRSATCANWENVPLLAPVGEAFTAEALGSAAFVMGDRNFNQYKFKQYKHSVNF
jgi:hypothetical protein